MQHHNRRATLAAIAAVIGLLLAGIWVLERLDASQKAQRCAERGGGNCAIIETDNEGRLKQR